jgi:hypothetical protein
MVAYIQEIIRDIIPRLQFRREEAFFSIASRFRVLVEELDRLDPRDFVVGYQYKFVDVRREMRILAEYRQEDWKVHGSELQSAEKFVADRYASIEENKKLANSGAEQRIKQMHEEISQKTGAIINHKKKFDSAVDFCKRLEEILDQYAGIGSHAVIRSFQFVQDAELRSIIERDYKELVQVLMPGFAWKSAVVMAGSILEAILHDQLMSPKYLSSAMACPKAPKKNVGAKASPIRETRDIRNDTSEDEWKLQDLIAVASEIGVIEKESEKHIDQVLRDYRNFVHPRKEIKAAHQCVEAQALMAKGSLDAVCNYLQK